MKLSFLTSLFVWGSDLLFYPIDTITTRIRANHKEHLSFVEATRDYIKNEGVRTLYRGYVTTFSCAFVPAFVYFLFYENLKDASRRVLDRYKHEKLKVFIPAFSGAAAEILALLTYLPFDTVRTRLQANLPDYQYRSVSHGLREIHRKEGMLRVFKASHLYLVTSTVYTGIQFQFYEMMRTHLLHTYRRESHQLNIGEKLSVGVVASALACIIVNPLDFLLTRFQILDSSKHTLSVRSIVRDVLKNEGPSAFFKGLGAKIVFSGMYSIFYLPIYDYFRQIYGLPDEDEDASVPAHSLV